MLRDIIYTHNEIQGDPTLGSVKPSETEKEMTAGFSYPAQCGYFARAWIRISSCWGGHSIGLRGVRLHEGSRVPVRIVGLMFAIGCGPGAMKGPMKGATIGHAKQRITGALPGLTEPGIIASSRPTRSGQRAGDPCRISRSA